MDNNYSRLRQRMIRQDIAARGVRDKRVLEAVGAVPREIFVPAKYQSSAYDDNPVPIGMGQTISQPYIVALMTENLAVGPGDTVLEIGTGCGYQTAILAKLAKRVYTVERYSDLTACAQATLAQLAIDNVEYAAADGSKGWPGGGEFDRIIVTAAMPEICPGLIEQLKEGGMLVGPVGARQIQNLVKAVKKDGELVVNEICAVRFVPLVGEDGHEQ